MPVCNQKLKFLLIVALVLPLFSGCFVSQINTSDVKASAAPDYRAPQSRFIQLDFFTMTSDFINDYGGKYIVFEGYYSGIVSSPHLVAGGLTEAANDMQSFYIREEKHSRNYVRVVYPNAHQEDVKEIVFLNRHRSRLRVFAYVLSSGQPARLRNGELFRPFEETLIWLVKVDITFDDGIHYRSR